ncbi:MAG: GAF domain-containing protein [Thermoguttaceae bacterium]|nr:GAF domain-containing protein [Thermoguttaceae bacterium]
MFPASSAPVAPSQILDSLSSAVALLDSKRRVVWRNEPFARLVGAESPDELVGRDFYRALGRPRFVDGDFCPLHFVVSRGVRTRTFFVVPGDKDGERFYEMSAQPFVSPDANVDACALVEIQDVTEAARDDKRLQRLSKTRVELFSRLDDAAQRGESVEQRTEILKRLVQKHMNAALNYDVYEIRLVGADKELIPFLSLGMQPETEARLLYASPSKNGITGYVASCGETYICEDIKNDPYYIVGAIDAASSITLPIVYLNQTIGVVNIESRTPNAFSRRDRRYLELYLADLAQALHRLDLLQTETARVRDECACELRDAFFDAGVALVDASFERYAQKRSSDPDRAAALRDAQTTRDAVRHLKPIVKRLTNKWSERPIAPPSDAYQFAELQDRRVLVVDRDRRFLAECVEAFEPYGCVVDVARNTRSALSALQTTAYDLVLSEIYPDGEYFTAEEKEGAFGRNERECNLFDVHLPDYGLPIPGDARDAEIRRRVLTHIADGKLDAFFFYEAFQALGLERAPELALAMTDAYDPTHVLRDLADIHECWPVKILKTVSLAKKLSKLTESLRRRDA